MFVCLGDDIMYSRLLFRGFMQVIGRSVEFELRIKPFILLN